MPIYEYKCDKCGHLFEVLQTKNKQSEKCEKCGAKAPKLPASRVGFVFKGSGFYVNDYKKSGSSSGSTGKTEDRGQKSEGGGSDAQKSGSGSQKSEAVKTAKAEDRSQGSEGGKKAGGTEARKKPRAEDGKGS